VTLFAVIFLYIYGAAAIPALFLIPLVCWARVVMKRHTVSQVMGGTFLTGGISSALFYFKDHYGNLKLEPGTIIYAMGLSLWGSHNLGMILTAVFIIFACQFQRLRHHN